uniref:Methyltransferase domain-containing protein n=1 Tax=Photinus pyralis TaxID=7054 RepID=A0A1Y1MFP9_PHOPY
MVALSVIFKYIFGNMSKKVCYPSAHRNRQPILEALQKHIPSDAVGNILEISSGTGQHASFFAEHFPTLTFHTSEYEVSLFDSIKAYADQVQTKNVKDPIYIDVTEPHTSWNLKEQHFDYVLNINMMHISPPQCAVGLFQNSAQLLKSGGLLFTYGPYANDGVITPQSNIDFDRNLRTRNKEWGLRDIQDLKKLAAGFGIQLLEIYNLPANNKCLVWRK